MIKLRNLHLSYGKNEILNIPSLDINTKKITALMGSNGSGKSTLIRVLSRLQSPNSGEISLWGESKPSLEMLRKISVLLPEPALLKRSVRENFKAILKSRNLLREFDERTSEALALVGLDEKFLNKRHFELSSGQTQRIAFALALSLRVPFYLLDEPTNSVDIATSKLFSKAINLMHEKYGCGFVIASHDEKWLSILANECVFLHKGKVCEFEYKNIFEIKDGVLNFGDESLLKLPLNFKDKSKITINPSKIKISKNSSEAQISGYLHSASLYMGNEKLLKVKVDDFLIKIFSHDDEILKIGERVYLEFQEGSMLALE
ncbi:tungstate ABC transporter ATP-binding protein TupC [Campylobacter sp.]|uniref:tungstate ABC transporter ATP-binding protein TupC n=1 Tax=Campylobacter sp. TaxID=205 RepID=UPI003FA168FB